MFWKIKLKIKIFMQSLLLVSFYLLYVGKPCALFCSPVGKEQPILLSEKVMDGTSCGYQGLDICANGRCQVRRSKRENIYAEGGLCEPWAAARCGGEVCPKIQKMSWLSCYLDQVWSTLYNVGCGLDNLYYPLLVERMWDFYSVGTY